MIESDDPAVAPAPVRWHRLALLLPFVWQLGFAGLANGVTWRPLGLPFQMVWQMAGVLVASASIALVFRRDEALDRRLEGDRA